jgi:rhodanese-related sulfurtransferase
MTECNVEELKEFMSKGEGILIDVREYAEFANGRIPGAKLVPLADIEKRYTEIPRDKTVFVICRTGRRSSEAERKLLALGFSDVQNVAGGFEAWKAAGFEYEKDAKSIWSLERQVRFTAGFLVLLGVVLSLLVHPYFIGLPAFIGAGLMFAAITDTCGMAMLLAKMPWNKTTQDATCVPAKQ